MTTMQMHFALRRLSQPASRRGHGRPPSRCLRALHSLASTAVASAWPAAVSSPRPSVARQRTSTNTTGEMRVGAHTAVGTPARAVSRVERPPHGNGLPHLRDGQGRPEKVHQERTGTKRCAIVALGYARRSKESTARTVSLEDQRARIETYCQEHEWSLAEVVADDGVSGGRRQRLERLAERVKVTGARVIIVYHLDRFARDLAATLDYLRRFARRGVELHVVGRGRVEADTATGFIVTAVEGLAAEHYRRVISEKTRDALARLWTKGRRVSRFAP